MKILKHNDYETVKNMIQITVYKHTNTNYSNQPIILQLHKYSIQIEGFMCNNINFSEIYKIFILLITGEKLFYLHW